MRTLTPDEISQLDEIEADMKEDGYSPIEATIGELADLKVGTSCGQVGNTCFVELAKNYKHRLVRGWLSDKPIGNEAMHLNGMVHIKMQTESTAEKLSRIADRGNGSLRFEGESVFENFMSFEIE